MNSLSLVIHATLAFVLGALCTPVTPASLAASGSIRGTVVWEDGTPAAGATIRWRSLNPDDVFELDVLDERKVSSSKTGTFEVEKLAKGPFRLEVTARAPAATSDWFAIVPEVAPGSQPIRVVMKHGSSVKGRVVDVEGKPVTSFRIKALQQYALKGPKDKAGGWSGPTARSFDAPDGQFVFEGLPDGEWELSVVTKGRTRAPSVRVTLPGDAQPIELRAPSKASIAGHVVDPKGRGVAGAQVRLAFQHDGKFAVISTSDLKAETDKEGAFKFDDVDATLVQLNASSTEWGKCAPMEIDLGSKTAPKSVVLKMGPTGTLQGSVIDSAGKPVANCTVAPSRDGDDDFLNTPSATTDAKGQFEITALSEGTYDVLAFTEKTHPSGAMTGNASIEITAGKTARVRIQIKK